jgi:hypothetical protein
MKSELEALAWYAGVGIKLEAGIRCLDRCVEGSFCGLLTFKHVLNYKLQIVIKPIPQELAYSTPLRLL